MMFYNLPACSLCGRMLKINEKNVCRECEREQELFCIRCEVNLRHGRSKYCFDCLQKIRYNKEKQYRLRKKV